MTEELSTKDDGLDPILAQDDKKALTVLTDLWTVGYEPKYPSLSVVGF